MSEGTEKKAPRGARAGGADKPAAKAPKAGAGKRSPFRAEADGDRHDWRKETLASIRALIREAEPEITEEVKWRKPSNGMAGVPVWSRHGIVCTGETYAKVVKLTFAQGAGLPDPSGLFNSSLDGNTRRAIDLHEGETVNAAAFQALVRAAVARNDPSANKAGPGAKKVKPAAVPGGEVVLLSGGNPQIAKADGDTPVQAYIAAMPGWKSDVGRWLDAVIVRNVPGVRKAVRWNSPFYGIEGRGWFLSVHCLTKYVKVTFFKGLSLQPVPAGGTDKSKDARWIDLYENDPLDEAQMAAWVKQAAALPGWDFGEK